LFRTCEVRTCAAHCSALFAFICVTFAFICVKSFFFTPPAVGSPAVRFPVHRSPSPQYPSPPRRQTAPRYRPQQAKSKRSRQHAALRTPAGCHREARNRRRAALQGKGRSTRRSRHGSLPANCRCAVGGALHAVRLTHSRQRAPVRRTKSLEMLYRCYAVRSASTPSAACAAASRATGTRYGLHDT
jgi:hypothetical protein